MPAFGVVAADASLNASVSIYTFGRLSGIDTSSFSEGDELFVSTTAGALTSTAPTGESASIQKIAKVTRSDSSAGSIFISGAGRSNAVPNLDNGDIFIGNGSNQAVSSSLNTLIDSRLSSGDINIGEYGIDTTETSTTSTTQVAIHTLSATVFRSARFTVQVTNSTDSTYHLTEILMIHDGTTPSITEYGTIFTGSAEATFDADISSGNVRLLATPASTDSMEFKVVCHSITV